MTIVVCGAIGASLEKSSYALLYTRGYLLVGIIKKLLIGPYEHCIMEAGSLSNLSLRDKDTYIV